MPGIVRRVLIFAAVDGLILQPAPPRNHKAATEQAIKVEYRTNAVSPLLKDRRDADAALTALDAHGIVGMYVVRRSDFSIAKRCLGLLRIASSSFLVSISRREQVAQIRGKPIYSISEVALIPLSSQSDAERAIVRARDSQQRHTKTGEIGEDFQSESDVSEDEREDNISLPEEPSAPSSPPNERIDSTLNSLARKTSIAEDVIHKKGLYGRFAQKWFSRGGWATDSRRTQGMSSEEDLSRMRELQQNPTAAVELDKEHEKHVENLEPFGEHKRDEVTQNPPQEIFDTAEVQAEETRIPMLPKVLTVTKMFFSSKSFYFAYDYDLSRSLVHQPATPLTSPLHQTFDPLVSY